MPITYRIFEPHRLAYAEGTGLLTDEHIASHAHQLLSDPKFELGFRELLDLSPVTDNALTADGVFKTADAVIVHKERLAHSNLAIVASNDEMFGMARMYETNLSLYLEGIQVFRTIDPALEFLGLESSLLATLRQALI